MIPSLLWVLFLGLLSFLSEPLSPLSSSLEESSLLEDSLSLSLEESSSSLEELSESSSESSLPFEEEPSQESAGKASLIPSIKPSVYTANSSSVTPLAPPPVSEPNSEYTHGVFSAIKLMMGMFPDHKGSLPSKDHSFFTETGLGSMSDLTEAIFSAYS